MKTLRTLFVIAIALVGFTSVSFGQQNTATVGAPTPVGASARIIQAITLEKNQDKDLKFGDIISSNQEGNVVLSPVTSTRTPDHGVTLGNTNTAGPAVFTVTGVADATYDIILPNTELEISDGSGHQMTVKTFTSAPEGSAVNSTRGSLTNGTQNFKVGATLVVGAGQQAGSYSGNFPVSVNYN
jgi:hypothetical protein